MDATLERFWAKVDRSAGWAGCWEWTASRRNGYGQIYVSGVGVRYAHRYIMEAITGRTLTRHDSICHKCDNRGCVNPSHLWIGNQKENLQDAAKKGRLTYERPWRRLAPKACEFCGEQYVPYRLHNQERRYCSVPCSNRSRSDHLGRAL